MDFDKFFEETVSKDNEVKEEKTLDEIFEKDRIKWKNIIIGMNEKFKDVFKINDLLIDVYTQRQLAVEYYHYLISKFEKIQRLYRKEYSQRYDYYTYQSQKRFPNERTKEIQILSDIENVLNKRMALDNHIKYMSETIKTIDNIIFGIKYKIELEQMSRGK